jgi:hypothetical protein
MIHTQIYMKNFCSQNATSMYNKHDAFFSLTLRGNKLTDECPYLRKGYYALTQMDRGQTGQSRPHVEALAITIQLYAECYFNKHTVPQVKCCISSIPILSPES